MEVKSYDVVVVSAFGRGHWLAAELQSQKIRVLLVDVTPRLGVWPSEDGEGPFGVFRLDKFSDSFLESLVHGDPVEAVENGFSIWLPSGPLELKGPLTRFHWERLGFPFEWLDFLGRGGGPLGLREETPFEMTWPLALARQLSSTHYLPSAFSAETGRAMPLAASFGVRTATRQGHIKSLDWVRRKNVDVTDGSEILDLSFGTRGRVAGLEMKGEKAGVIRCEELVWTLTGAETAFLSEKVSSHLYPGGGVNPSWCWVRYRLQVSPHATIERLPLHVVMIQDMESPWTHENLMILQKTASDRNLDIWVRIPAVQRFNKGYVEENGRRMMEVIDRRLPASEATIQDYPQEYSYISQELGPPRFPIWSQNVNPGKTRLKSPNVHFENSENRASYTLDEGYDHQLALRDRLVSSWQIRQEKIAKENTR